MQTVLLVIHILLALGLIGVILLQRSEGGALGIGGGGGVMTGRGAADLLTRTTAILAGAFMLTSIVLAILAGGVSEKASIFDGEQPVQTEPAEPAGPAVPQAD